MEKLILKKYLADACKQVKLEALNGLREEIEGYQESANEYGPAQDRYDSYREQLATKRDMLETQLHKVQMELDLLERIDVNREHEYAGFGAVVYTNLQRVFISIGIGKIKLEDGSVIYAVSPSVPFAMAVKDLKKGDKFQFNGKQLEITDLF